MQTRNVLMFGGRSVGKSSVLAAIYDQAGNLLNNAGLDWVAETEAFNVLRAKKNNLVNASKKTDEDDPFPIPRMGDLVTSKYKFEFGKKASAPEIELVFIDTAGGRFKDGDKEFESLFEQSNAAILVIDAIELMLGEDINEQDKQNDADQVLQHVRKWLRHDSEQPKLLCIVLAKTERWLRERGQHNHNVGVLELHAKLESKFENVFSYLRDDKLKSKVALTICPVQTCGNIIFDKYVEQDGKKLEYVRAIKGKETAFQKSTGYAPLDCDQPLRYILAFYLKMHLQAKKVKISNDLPWWMPRIIASFVSTFVQMFNDPELINAVNTFSSGIKTQMPFKIEQGEHLIK
jgi:hypothetical protein